MTLSRLVELLADKADTDEKRARLALDELLREIADAVLKRGERVRLPGFGDFYAKTHAARRIAGITGKRQLAARVAVGFRAAPRLRKRLGRDTEG